MATYGDKEKDLKGELKDLDQEIEGLKQDQQDQLAAENALRVQLTIIQANQPQALTPALQRSFLKYLQPGGRPGPAGGPGAGSFGTAAPTPPAAKRIDRRLGTSVEATGGHLEGRIPEASGPSRASPGTGGTGVAEPGNYTGAGLGVAQ